MLQGLSAAGSLLFNAVIWLLLVLSRETGPVPWSNLGQLRTAREEGRLLQSWHNGMLCSPKAQTLDSGSTSWAQSPCLNQNTSTGETHVDGELRVSSPDSQNPVHLFIWIWMTVNMSPVKSYFGSILKSIIHGHVLRINQNNNTYHTMTFMLTLDKNEYFIHFSRDFCSVSTPTRICA